MITQYIWKRLKNIEIKCVRDITQYISKHIKEGAEKYRYQMWKHNRMITQCKWKRLKSIDKKIKKDTRCGNAIG